MLIRRRKLDESRSEPVFILPMDYVIATKPDLGGDLGTLQATLAQ